MKATFTVLFYLRKTRADENGLAPVMARITINGERAQFNTRTMADPALWDSKAGKCIGRSQEITKTNRILEALKVKITELYHKQLNEYGYVLPEKIKNIVLESRRTKRKCSWNILGSIMSSTA